MGRAGRPTVAIELSDEERETLQRWARRHSSAQALALRCRIVLAVAEGGTNTEIADRLGTNRTTVGKWRHRFAADRLEGLADAPRPGAARQIGDDVVEAIVVETLETTPKDATHWSTRALAERHGISRQTVSEIWRAFGLKPWRQDEFKVSPDPDLVEKIRDLVGLCTCRRRSPPRSSRSTRNRRSRPSTGPRRRCRCCPPPRPRPPTTTSATAPSICSPPWRSPPAR